MVRRNLPLNLTVLLVLALSGTAQDAALSISENEILPTASLWEQYWHKLESSGGVGVHHWMLVAGSIPRGMRLDEYGEIEGKPQESGSFEFTLQVRDSNSPPSQEKKKLTVTVEAPMSADWERPVKVSGQRIDGSIKVSNRSGRDFDLTVIVLAVNDIGRATAIGYQHFSLKPHTLDISIPFGDRLSPGRYAVNVEVVGEEPISNQIFRARLVKENEQIGP